MKMFSKGVRKYIRHKKSQIRKSNLNTEEQDKAIENILNSFSPRK